MGLFDFLGSNESLIAVDVGSSYIKLIELDITGSTPKLVNIGIAPLSGEVFSNNMISDIDYVSDQVTTLLENNGVEDRRVITAMPGPSVFTKKIKMANMDQEELANNIQFEASNFIPHSIDDVQLDYHLIGDTSGKQLDILVVAVKNEIIDSFIEALALAGLEAAVVDVDYFALQNVFETNYPELKDETVALINMGSRYSSINICRGGESLFTGDISIGGSLFTEAIQTEMGVSEEDAEQLKTDGAEGEDQGTVKDIIDRNIEYAASEFNRQLSFFWNASGAEDGIDRIMLTGGGSLIEGLREELSEKTGLECESLDPFKAIECDEDFDSAYLKEISPLMSVSVGLGIRQPGDKDNVSGA